MKTDLHPTGYQIVVFEDLNNGTQFLTKSTAVSDDTIKWEDGNTYPLIKVHITSASHPFFTGQEKLVDVEGRVDKFQARRDAAKAAKDANAKKAAKPKKKKKSADVLVQKIGEPKQQTKK